MSKTSIAIFLGLGLLIYALGPWNQGSGGISSSRASGHAESGPAVTITPENFEREVMQSRTPVLAYFWAPW